jgi:hypothetical protein
MALCRSESVAWRRSGIGARVLEVVDTFFAIVSGGIWFPGRNGAPVGAYLSDV